MPLVPLNDTQESHRVSTSVLKYGFRLLKSPVSPGLEHTHREVTHGNPVQHPDTSCQQGITPTVRPIGQQPELPTSDVHAQKTQSTLVHHVDAPVSLHEDEWEEDSDYEFLQVEKMNLCMPDDGEGYTTDRLSWEEKEFICSQMFPHDREC